MSKTAFSRCSLALGISLKESLFAFDRPMPRGLAVIDGNFTTFAAGC